MVAAWQLKIYLKHQPFISLTVQQTVEMTALLDNRSPRKTLYWTVNEVVIKFKFKIKVYILI